MTAWGRRVPEWARRPGGLVEQTRWLFCGCALLALGLTVPGPLLSTSNEVDVVVVVCASVALAASWVWRYRTRGDAAWLDVVNVLATTAFAAACPDPAMAFGFAFSASWLRVLYGSTPQVVLFGLSTVAGIAAAIPLWSVVPGHVGSTAAAPTLGALSVLFLTVVVARYLALVLFAREQSQRRDTALLQLGGGLLGVTDRGEVSRVAWDAIGQICLATRDSECWQHATPSRTCRSSATRGSSADPRSSSRRPSPSRRGPARQPRWPTWRRWRRSPGSPGRGPASACPSRWGRCSCSGPPTGSHRTPSSPSSLSLIHI